MARQYSSVSRFRITVPALPEVPQEPSGMFPPAILVDQITFDPNYINIPFRLADEQVDEPVNVAAILSTIDDDIPAVNIVGSGVSVTLAKGDVGEIPLPNTQSTTPQTYDVLFCTWKD